jgi:hypothetical protein
MSSWAEVQALAPQLAEAVGARFDRYGLAILATLRTNGWPRLSGIEPAFRDGELWLGMMTGSHKAADLQRDGRLALHAATTDKNVAEGDAKLTGVARSASEAERTVYLRSVALAAAEAPESPEHPEEFELFLVDVTEMSTLRLAGDHLVIESWAQGREVRSVDRY